MTEEEARTKWCPYARLMPVHPTREGGWTGEHRSPSGYNRGANVVYGATTPVLPDSAACVASVCMAWRWHPEADEVRELREKFGVGFEEAKRKAASLQTPAKQGFCGLAGKP